MTHAPSSLPEARASPSRGWAVVTGASSGIGEAIAHDLGRRGFGLVLAARREDRLNAVASALEVAYDVPARVVVIDLATPEGPGALHEAVRSEGIRVRILVNNAGLGAFGRFEELPLERQLRVIRVNVSALTELSWRFARDMLSRDGGAILNVASTGGLLPGPLNAVYYASKAAVISFSEAFHEELRGRGVSVTALCPGPTDSEFHAQVGMGRPGRRASAESVARAAIDGTLAGRARVVPGTRNRLLTVVTGAVPRPLLARVMHRVQRRRR